MDDASRDNQDSLFGVSERLADLIVRDLDGDLSLAELAELRDALKHSAQARTLYVRWGFQARVLAEAFGPGYAEGQADGSSADVPALGVVEVSEANYPQLLAELNRMEAKAPVIAFPASPFDTEAGQQDDASSSTSHDLAVVGRYALRLALTSRPAKRIYAYAAAAVIVLLVGIFFIPRGVGDASIAGQQPSRQDPPQDTAVTVATLTAEHHAQWQSAEGALAPGSALQAGQTLVLTDGFAEITTNDGAVAILEAPCTVLFSYNKNALTLIRGKLVGICETESSQGFAVSTPHLEIVDHGTRFGVFVGNETVAHVIDGEIQVDVLQNRTPDTALRLAADQTAVMGQGQDQAVLVDRPTMQFITDWSAIPPRLTGNIEYERTVPADLRIGAFERDRIILFHERSGLRLDEPVEVTLTEPGIYDEMSDLGTKLPAGLVVDSYLLHLDPSTNVRPEELASTRVYQAEIRFNKPIVGLMTTSQHLSRAHGLFGKPGVSYSDKPEAGLERSEYNANLNDRIELSDDRRTLTIELFSGLALDQFRVLIEHEAERDE